MISALSEAIQIKVCQLSCVLIFDGLHHPVGHLVANDISPGLYLHHCFPLFEIDLNDSFFYRLHFRVMTLVRACYCNHGIFAAINLEIDKV